MFEKKLKEIIPGDLTEFPKLLGGESPYFFLRWDIDSKSKQIILRYWFWDENKVHKNKKRIFINEFEDLIKKTITSGFLQRTDYNEICTKTCGDGTCGFAVIVAILNHVDVIQKKESGKYALKNKNRLQDFID